MKTENDLMIYITDRKYDCEFCIGLQERVAKYGIDEIPKYNGMVCAGVEDMKIRYYELLDNMKDKRMCDMFDEVVSDAKLYKKLLG